MRHKQANIERIDQEIDQYLYPNIASIIMALNDPAEPYIEYQLPRCRDRSLIADHNRLVRFGNDFHDLTEGYDDTLVPGKGVVTWREKAIVTQINFIHATIDRIPAPPLAMHEYLRWRYHNDPAPPTPPRWHYWFYNPDGSLRDHKTLKGHGPIAWHNLKLQAAKNLNFKQYKRCGKVLEIPPA